MDQVTDAYTGGETDPGEELIAARLGRWAANDQAIILGRRLKSLQAEHALCDARLRRLADELLHELDRRRAADDLVQSLNAEIVAIRATRWWRLGVVPRWIRSHIR